VAAEHDKTPLNARPPKFLFAEVVRVVGATGSETDDLDEPIDAAALIGQEFVVQGARPTNDQQGWVIHLWVEALDVVCDVPEEGLEQTGLIEVTDADGRVERVPLDPDKDRGWRDDVLLELVTETRSKQQAARIAKTAVAAVGERVEAEEVKWRLTGWRAEPLEITLWVFPVGDALAAFERLVGSPKRGWQHDEDEGVFISSRWERPAADDVVFLASGVRSAEVTYRRWTSPKRRSRGARGRDGSTALGTGARDRRMYEGP
jgi:hypothetical protein